MNNFEYLKSLAVDELAAWLDKYGQFDGAPWTDWFDETYCKKCKPIEIIMPDFNNRKTKCNYCELEDKCKFFPEYEHALGLKEILKLWLLTERE